MNYYLKWSVNKLLIFNKIRELNSKKINFFLDIQSVCRGFYNKQSIMMELGRFATEGKPSDILIQELRVFLNNIYKDFKQYDPFFILFYDDGHNLQNKIIYNNYKQGSFTNQNSLFLEDSQEELYKNIKLYYFNSLPKYFNKHPGKVFYLKEYESDCVPQFCINSNLYDSADLDVMNIIFSTDKDLLQSTKHKNTFQHITEFISGGDTGKKQFVINLYEDYNAISYIYKNFKPGLLTSKHIPLILSISGDHSDKIPGLKNKQNLKKGVGPKTAIDMITQYKIPTDLVDIRNNLSNMPQLIQENFSVFERNMKLIDFNLQISRMPISIWTS